MKSIRLALWIWYRGDAFRGFQRQPEGPTVQEVLETALRAQGVRGAPMPAGRTDKGVHARMQVVSVRLPKSTSIDALVSGVRALLPPTLGLAAARVSHPSFHAQWSSAGKEYRYRLSNAPSPEWEAFCWGLRSDERLAGGAVDLERAVSLLSHAVGTRDFIAFHEKSSIQKPRTLRSVRLVELAPGIFELRLRGDAFGRHQVRYLVGSAVAVAAGRVPEELFLEGLARGTAFEGLRAPAQGLILWEVTYAREVDPFESERARWEREIPSVPPFTPLP